MKPQKVQRIVLEQIAQAIEADLGHGESLMKEAFEQMESDDDMEHCYDEMKRIIAWLRGPHE